MAHTWPKKKEKKRKFIKSIFDTDSEDSDDTLDEMEARIVDCIERLTNLENQRKRRSVPEICRDILIPFKKTNVRNFLNAVRAATKEFDKPEDIKKVIEIAQSKVDDDVIISQKKYDDYDSFCADILKQFKPSEDPVQLTQRLMMLQQKIDEDVDAYGQRVLVLKDKYVNALFAQYTIEGSKLSEERVKEAEALAKRSFITGLKSEVREYIRGEPETLATAIAAAKSAEASSSLNRTVKSFYGLRLNERRQQGQSSEQRTFRRDGRRFDSGDRAHQQRFVPRNDRYNRSGGPSRNFDSKPNNFNYRPSRENATSNKPFGESFNKSNGESSGYNRYNGENRGFRSSPGGSTTTRGCYTCGDVTHLARDCPKSANQKNEQPSCAETVSATTLKVVKNA